MKKTRNFYFAMLGLTVISFGLTLGGLYFANTLLQAQSDKLMEAKLNARVLEEQQVALSKANKDIAKYADLEKIATSIVPQEKDQARTVREIINYANQSGISIQSISFPTSTLGQSAPAAAPTTEGSPAPAATATPAVTQVKPVEGLKGVFQLELVVQSDSKKPVTFTQLNTFLAKLEQNRRTAQVSGISITPKTEDRRFLTFSLNIIVYIKP